MGQVTKYAGGVVKGFALIAGIIVTGIAQWIVDGKPLGNKDLLAVILVSVSIFLHSKFPASKKAVISSGTAVKDSKGGAPSSPAINESKAHIKKT